MKKIVLAALVCAAVAGVVLYLKDPESFEDSLEDVKDEAGKKYKKMKKGFSKSKEDLEHVL